MNPTSRYTFTILVPIFNEQEVLPQLEERLSAYIATAPVKSCVLLIDDCSTDDSLECIRAICRRQPHFLYLHFAHNQGISGVMKAGAQYIESKYTGYIDADLQTSPEDFTKLLNHIEDYTLVTGYRASREDSIRKKIQSKIGNGFRRMFTHDGARDTGCPLKVIHTDAMRKIPFFKGMHRFIPALVLLQRGGCYMQLPVEHHPRVAGKSKFNMWNRIGAFKDCIVYCWMKSHYIEPEISESSTGE